MSKEYAICSLSPQQHRSIPTHQQATCHHCGRKPLNKPAGFTLIELMIVIALAGIILTIAVPSFRETIRNNHLATQANEFVSSLQLARSEAIKRGARVAICKSADGTNCTSDGGYQQGWIVFADINNNAQRDSAEEIIQVFGAISDAKMTLTGNTPVMNYVSYTSMGRTKSTSGAFQAGTLTLCKDSKARQIIISSTGRVRTVANTSC